MKGGETNENQHIEFCDSERGYSRDFVDILLADGVDGAGRDDDDQRAYGSYGYEQIRLDVFAGELYLGTRRVERIRRSFRVDFSDRL